MPDGEFDCDGRLRKGIGGAQRFPQNGRKPFEECKGRRELDCDTDGWSLSLIHILTAVYMAFLVTGCDMEMKINVTVFAGNGTGK